MEKTGLVYAPGDAKALAACALTMIENPAVSVSYGAAARGGAAAGVQ